AALDSASEIAFRFWSSQARESMASLPTQVATPTYHQLTRQIAAASRLPRKQREHLIAVLAAAVAPVAA
ncbi:MAG TPA: hypothetical protein PLI95_22350, partial [Polyangiaceae bacterium]|nr:hypothetical protein [Polyangiaceae bacterium]